MILDYFTQKAHYLFHTEITETTEKGCRRHYFCDFCDFCVTHSVFVSFDVYL